MDQDTLWEDLDDGSLPTPPAASGEPPTRTGRFAWIAAAIGALLLIGGGAFFALNALSEDGGSDTPEAAVTAMFEALSNEDFVTVATLVEPTERRTMVQPTFEIVEQLQRLGVLADDLDTASVDGIDLEYTNVEFTTTRVTDQLYQARITSGETVSSFDVSELPLGELVRSRLSAEDLNESGTERELIESSDVPIAIVERDGRWYWSLWYTIGEIARGQTNPFPPTQPPIEPKGVDAPEQVANAIFERAFDLDLEALIGLLDPQEAAALYEYSPLFLPELSETVDELRTSLSDEGYSWKLDQVQTEADVDGDDAVVGIRSMTVSARGPGLESVLEFRLNEGPGWYIGATGVADAQPFETSVSIGDDGCMTYSVDFPDEDPINERSCAGDDLDGDELTPEQIRALDALTQPDARSTFAVRRVDGLWYLSPTTTFMQSLLTFLQPLDQADLDALIDLFVDYSEGSTIVDGSLFGESAEPPASPAPLPDPLEPPEPLDDTLVAPEAVLAQRFSLDRDTEGAAFHGGELAEDTFDEHELVLQADESVAVIMRSTDFDSFLQVRRIDGEVIAFNDDFDGLDSGLDLTGPGRFFIEARALDPLSSGAYSLEIHDGALARTLTERPPRELGAVSSDSTTTNELVAGSADVYTIDLTAGQEITIELSAADGAVDPHLAVVRDAQELASNDDYTELDSALEFVAPEPGSYQIYVSDYYQGAGPYELTVTTGLHLGQ